MKDTLVVYYSRTGKTRFVAERLAALLNADLEEITDAADYRGALGYVRAGRDTMLKHSATLTSRHAVEGRTAVVLGMPVWAFAPPPAIRAFVAAYDLAGKAVSAFATMEGSGGERTLDTLAGLIPGGLKQRLVLKKPGPDDPALADQLKAWAGTIREAVDWIP